ncbi:MerR family transcriptional regulator [Halobacteriovorax sp.]|uniref:MerR family transcriptional regulator n=1 Tax=Halobacteriovorax sp. TaxID=2020862 RepID=UPI00356A8771
MQTKDIIELTGLDRETLRFYEKKGIISTPKRTTAGYRKYSDEVIDRINFTLMAKEAGFTLSEIKELLNLKESGVNCKTGRDIALDKINEVDDRMKSLRNMKKVLKKFVSDCENTGGPGLKRKCHLSFDVKKVTK